MPAGLVETQALRNAAKTQLKRSRVSFCVRPAGTLTLSERSLYHKRFYTLQNVKLSLKLLYHVNSNIVGPSCRHARLFHVLGMVHPDAQRAYRLAAPLVCGKNIHRSNDILYSFPVTSNVIGLRFVKHASFASQNNTSQSATVQKIVISELEHTSA